jgi:hypothetical protein
MSVELSYLIAIVKITNVRFFNIFISQLTVLTSPLLNEVLMFGLNVTNSDIANGFQVNER